MPNLTDILEMSDAELVDRARRDPGWWDGVLGEFAAIVDTDVREAQLAHYLPANPMALPVHLATAREVAVVGGNRSSKSSTLLAELAIQMTGIVPESLRGIYPTQKLRPPIRARIVCNSLTDTLEPIIKPKLRWDQWNGVGEPAGGKGHWGWIPRRLLKGGKWEDAYHDKTRTLYTAVESFWGSKSGIGMGTKQWSSCQFLSYDQELSAFVGSSMHFVGHDELPPQRIYRENQLRTLDVKGQIYTAFTPPDEAGTSRGDVSYFFDEVYERGLPGPDKHPEVETIVLHTEANSILDAGAVAAMAERLTEAQREVRLYGRFTHLSGVIFDDFTPLDRTWCFRCMRRVHGVDGSCPHCTGNDLSSYCHVVEPFPIPPTWPIIMVIDPHPRKPDAIIWAAVAPSDFLFVVAELEVEGTAEDVAREVQRLERRNRWQVHRRLGDPNILTERQDKQQRGWTMQQAYREVGLPLDLAVDNMNTGIAAVQAALRPDRQLRAPRLRFFSSCPRAIKAMSRWSWDEHRADDRELKEQPRDKFKDFCDCVRYFCSDNPDYARYKDGPRIYRRSR